MSSHAVPFTLAIDCASRTMSVAIGHAETFAHLASCAEVAGRSHDEKLSALVSKVLQHQHLSLSLCRAVLVGGGPGSFTGIRIGLAFAKGLALGLGLPLTMYSSASAEAYAGVEIGAERIAVLGDAGTLLYYVSNFLRTEWPLSMRTTAVVSAQELSSELAEVSNSEHGCIVLPQSDIAAGVVPHARKIVSANAAIGLLEMHERIKKESTQGKGRFEALFCHAEAGNPAQFAKLEPFYVRPMEAKTIAERQHGVVR